MRPNTLDVWAGLSLAGKLQSEESREGRKYVFAYDPSAIDAVSLTMPTRLESWVEKDLHPIFQMNLPEGSLLDAIRQAIAKIIGEDDLSILMATGGNQIGKNKFVLPGENALDQQKQVESLSEILTYPDTTELFHELVDKYALRSGVSGVQPKVLLNATGRDTLAAQKYIVKSWGQDYPQLAANEFFCMSAALKSGLPVPPFHLADNGGLFVMQRFDIDKNGQILGFEDMCSLLGLGAKQKYNSTYERVAKVIKYFVSSENKAQARKQFFASLVLSSMVQNGDAHLKNFGVVYAETHGPVAIAPVYDIITTTAYLMNDVPALSIDGCKKWWPRKMLEKYARDLLFLTNKEIREIIEQTGDAVVDTSHILAAYTADHPEFREVGQKMLECWNRGLQVFLPAVRG